MPQSHMAVNFFVNFMRAAGHTIPESRTIDNFRIAHENNAFIRLDF